MDLPPNSGTLLYSNDVGLEEPCIDESWPVFLDGSVLLENPNHILGDSWRGEPFLEELLSVLDNLLCYVVVLSEIVDLVKEVVKGSGYGDIVFIRL